MRILLADDQKEIRLLTVNQLQRDGHSVVAVSNGQDALAEFARSPFDILLLDELMPGMSGVDVLHAIRSKQQSARPLIIAVTGYNTEQDRTRLLREGFDAVIGKPFRLDSMEATLQEVSGASVSPAGTRAQREADNLLESVGGDQQLLLRMIRTFLRDAPKRMAQIESAIRSQRAHHLASSAHALKGSVAIFGATAAQQHCQELAELGRRHDLARAPDILAPLKEEIAKLEANLRGYAGQNSRPGAGGRPSLGRPTSAQKRKPR